MPKEIHLLGRALSITSSRLAVFALVTGLREPNGSFTTRVVTGIMLTSFISRADYHDAMVLLKTTDAFDDSISTRPLFLANYLCLLIE